ncbi:MAG TPA: twin-arginine translocase TatA/TatE family subunit [Bryobacteraceae bacterium]|nr:twin-arginine translocase TatA/TatE family subunit [Bryobacteraceae bacterium]
MGPIGAQEMMFIVLLALLLFGPKKLPELGRLLGKGLTEFRRAKNELKTTFESHMQELERETRLSEQAEADKRNPPSESQQYSSATYPYPYDEYGRESSSYTPAEESSGAAAEQPNAAQSSPEPVSGTVPRSKMPPAAGPPMTAPAAERSENAVAEEQHSA